MKNTKDIRLLVRLSPDQINFIEENFSFLGVDPASVVKIIIAQLMSGDYVKKSNVIISSRPALKEKSPKEAPAAEVIPQDVPGMPYHRLTPGKLEDIERADIVFYEHATRSIIAGTFYRNGKGEITDPDLPASNIRICSDLEFEKLPPSIKYKINKKWAADPTGGVSGDTMREKVKREIESVNYLPLREVMPREESGESEEK